jgi:predicted nucleic acid-binding protein
VYLDSAYIVKFYVNEPESAAVRNLIAKADVLSSTNLAVAEVTCALHRHMREGSLNRKQISELLAAFLDHIHDGVWNLVPLTDGLLNRTALLVRAMPEGVPLRAADAIHLTTALDLGEREVWTNDRHLLAAAPHFGLLGRSV